MNQHNPDWIYREEVDTRTPYERLNALACDVIDTSLARSIYRGNDEAEVGFLEKRQENAEAQFIREIEEYGNPDLLAEALSHCSWKSVIADVRKAA